MRLLFARVLLILRSAAGEQRYERCDFSPQMTTRLLRTFVLADSDRPAIGGLEVLALHETHERLFVVTMFRGATTAVTVEALRAGAMDVLEKAVESTNDADSSGSSRLPSHRTAKGTTGGAR